MNNYVTEDEIYFKDIFTETEDGINIEANNLKINCLTSKENFIGTETQLRSLLAKFLFYGENVFKRVSALSGGEKVCLKLFDLIHKKANFLIFDEPTNHIDIETKEMLEEALKDYRGTILFISHDRYFINKSAQKTLNIENYQIKQYLGNYDYYKKQLDTTNLK